MSSSQLLLGTHPWLHDGVVESYTMLELQPTGATRVTLEVIILSPTGLTPAKWEQTATLCPLDWPSNYSLLRLWHMNKSFHQYAAQFSQQMQHRHMFSHWEINRIMFASRVLFPRPAHCAPEVTLMQHVQAREFPSRRLRKRMPDDDQAAFPDKYNGLRLRAEEQEALHPVPSRLAIVGMRPFDRTNTITSNTLQEV